MTYERRVSISLVPVLNMAWHELTRKSSELGYSPSNERLIEWREVELLLKDGVYLVLGSRRQVDTLCDQIERLERVTAPTALAVRRLPRQNDTDMYLKAHGGTATTQMRHSMEQSRFRHAFGWLRPDHG